MLSFKRERGVWRTIAKVSLDANHTGNLTETALATIPISAGEMGANGALRFTGFIGGTASANNKTWRLRLGGISGTEFANYSLTTSPYGVLLRLISNEGAANVQLSMPANSSNAFGNSTSAPATGAIDTSQAQDLVVSAQLASAGETMTLHGYTVELLHQP